MINDDDKFYDWFLSSNAQDMTVFDLAAQRSNKFILKYIFDIVKRTNGNRLELHPSKNNFIHYAAKRNECYSIVFNY